MKGTNKIIANTFILYSKMIITIVISLYSTRLILSSLGILDYGIFNLVGGIIAMLTFINISMTVASQRYLSIYMGRGDLHKLRQVFHSSVYLHLIIGFLVLIVLEILSLFLFNGILNIPESRIKSAKIVYHFMVVSTFFTINAVPYDASINANENMLFDSIVGVSESFVRLLVAVYLISYENDRLVLYGVLIALLIIVIRLVKSSYCYYKYPECRFSFKTKLDKSMFKEMFYFSSWSMFGVLASVGRNHGVAIILNLFYGAVINSAYAISNQISAQLNSFSSMMLKAVNPQIMKKEGADNREEMLNLAMKSSKISFFLFSLFAFPIITEMPVILKLWLKNVPDNTVVFSRLILLSVLLTQLTIGLQSAIQAIGKIKIYQTVVGGVLLMNIPLVFILLKFELKASYAITSFIFIEFIASGFRLYFVNKLASLSLKKYCSSVILPLLKPSMILITVCYLSILFIESNIRLVITCFFSCIIYIFAFYKYGTDIKEKDYIMALFLKIKGRLFFND